MFDNRAQAEREGCQLRLSGLVLNMFIFALSLPSSGSHATPTTTKAESAGPHRASPESTAPSASSSKASASSPKTSVSPKASASPSTPAPPAGSTSSWLERIGAGSASADIAVICDKAGVSVWAPDWRLTLSKTHYDWCLLDPYADLVWGAKGSKLYALDLQGSAAPSLVATQWPYDDAEGGARKLRLSYATGYLSVRADQESFSVSLNVETKQVAVSPEMDLREEEFATIGARITLVNRKNLTLWAERARIRTAGKRVGKQRLFADKIPEDPEGLCVAVKAIDDCPIDDCEHAPHVPRTTFCLVTIWENCHDGCESGYALYDPIKRAFLYGFNPEDKNEEYPIQQAPFPVSDTMVVSPSGQYVISGYVLSDWKQPLVEQGALGWLNLLRVNVNPQTDETRRKEVLRGVQQRAQAIQSFKTATPSPAMTDR